MPSAKDGATGPIAGGRRRVTILACALALVACAPARADDAPLPAPSEAAQACAGADAPATADTFGQATAAVLCLVNRERALRGLRPLHASGVLAVVAARYGQVMVAGRFLGHVSPTGSTLYDRLAGTAYLGGDYLAGENIATGLSVDATPEGVVAAWMGSALHRRNILGPLFRAVGIGVVAGMPTQTGADGVTYVADFGRRT
ncbi:MAG: hypothetical protein QOG35_1726 [Solirubrobacteraceae bacterium]|jgi:uncharacterized protein YkwD|nr:hypothetical protein [Solirubrobacteraceae bacterium]